jgi:hypothetical protein
MIPVVTRVLVVDDALFAFSLRTGTPRRRENRR